MNTAVLSTFTLIERSVAPIFHGLGGIILPHDHFSNSLATTYIILKKTMNMRVKKKLFQKAAEVLSEVWNKTMIYVYPVDCSCASFGKKCVALSEDSVWVSLLSANCGISKHILLFTI